MNRTKCYRRLAGLNMIRVDVPSEFVMPICGHATATVSGGYSVKSDEDAVREPSKSIGDDRSSTDKDIGLFQAGTIAGTLRGKGVHGV